MGAATWLAQLSAIELRNHKHPIHKLCLHVLPRMGSQVQAVQRNAPAKRNARRKRNAAVSERLFRGDAPVWMDAEQVSEWVSHGSDCGIFKCTASPSKLAGPSKALAAQAAGLARGSCACSRKWSHLRPNLTLRCAAKIAPIQASRLRSQRFGWAKRPTDATKSIASCAVFERAGCRFGLIFMHSGS